MEISPDTFRTFSNLLLSGSKNSPDVKANSLHKAFGHFMGHSFSKNNIATCRECSFLNKIIVDHLSTDCSIRSNEERCYFHEIVDHIVVCRHMILRGPHPIEGCRLCNSNGINKQYREKYEHAVSCTNLKCNTSCEKWKHFIQHLKHCSGCWICCDENNINSVYLREHSTQQQPSYPMANKPVVMSPHPSSAEPRHQMKRMPISIPNMPKQPHMEMPPQMPSRNQHSYNQGTVHPGMSPQNMQNLQQKVPHQSMPQQVPSQRMQISMPHQNVKIMRSDSITDTLRNNQVTNNNMQHMLQQNIKSANQARPNSLQNLTNPGQRSAQHPIQQAFTMSSNSTVMNNQSRMSQVFQQNHMIHGQMSSLSAQPKQSMMPLNEPMESRSYIPTNADKTYSIVSVGEELSRSKKTFDHNCQMGIETAVEIWLVKLLRDCVQNVRRKNGEAVGGVKMAPTNQLTGYVMRKRLGDDLTSQEKRNVATLDLLCNDRRDRTRITVDDIRNHVRCKRSMITSCLRQNTVL